MRERRLRHRIAQFHDQCRLTERTHEGGHRATDEARVVEFEVRQIEVDREDARSRPVHDSDRSVLGALDDACGRRVDSAFLWEGEPFLALPISETDALDEQIIVAAEWVVPTDEEQASSLSVDRGETIARCPGIGRRTLGMAQPLVIRK
ncbi:MAG: hypothetical protein CL933_02900 [Deltaproteobacteria bacterium]|nr:hypothetical protein [Deltaproteobacteria bacterium]